MAHDLSASLSAFSAWASTHITGDEKGQAQIFLDRLFQAFGHGGSLDVGGEPEFRVRKGKDAGGGTSFADYVWKPVVLIEMKKRGTVLSKHYRQAFDYWTRLVPNRPRFVVLCNFDEFEVYDFENQMDSPVGSVRLADLGEHYGPLKFLVPGQPEPIFENDRLAVTREAADCLASCFRRLRKRGIEQPLAQRFILQMLVSLFAEDIELLPKYFVTELLKEIKTPVDSYDLLGNLFAAMNTSPAVSGGRYKGVPYFNGGLFSEPARLELHDLELVDLVKAASYDWKKVQPEIFGTLFEHSLDDGSIEGTRDERRATGAHFTSPVDILKIVGPTLVEPWRAAIEGAKTLKRLGELRERMHRLRVLDPACGSGNFLYVSYREMKRLEARLFERIETEFPSKAEGAQTVMSYLSAQNFYGMDINPFAVEIAKVTMMIARKLSIDELHITERALPLDNLDQNFRAVDALVSVAEDGTAIRTPWPSADVIVGNPPFIGAKLLKPQLGPDAVRRLRALYPEVPGMADYCVYWIRRAHDHLPSCTAADPFAGRAGLVGTQNIRNNASRVGGLDHVAATGTIIEAVDNQPWSGEANVHVSIANWVKTQEEGLLPGVRRLWFKTEPTAAMKKAWRKAGKNAAKEYELGFREVERISSTLSDQTDVSTAVRLTCNYVPQVCFSGQFPRHHGFVITESEARSLIAVDPRNADVVHPFFIGAELLTAESPQRWVIDFQQMSILEARSYEKPFALIEDAVLPHVQEYASKEREKTGSETGQDQTWLNVWWQHFRCRKEMVDSISKNLRFIACSDTTKRPVFAFISSKIRPDHKLRVFAFHDDFSFGILQSHAHWLWFVTKCSKLAERFNYTSSSVFDTFPWPQSPDPAKVLAVAEAGREVRRIRAESLPKLKGGLRALYRTLELPGANPLKSAHAALDAAVLAAYGFSAKSDLLAQILALNESVAAAIEAGQPVTAPGLPAGYPDPASLVTEDCIRHANG